MTKYIDADKLKAHIQHLIKKDNYELFDVPELLSFIHSLQQEQLDIDEIKRDWHNKGYLEGRKNAHISARELGLPKSCDFQDEQPELDLNKEIRSMWEKCNPTDEGMGVESTYMHIEAFDIIARHFAEWGYLRAAEKYDEIEYNRQMAEEHLADARKTSPNDLEEAARKYQESVPVDTTIHYCGADEDVYFANRIVDAFIAGYNLCKEQMMKDAVEGEIRGDIRNQEEKPYQIWAE
jgi:hypothetical protein